MVTRKNCCQNETPRKSSSPAAGLRSNEAPGDQKNQKNSDQRHFAQEEEEEEEERRLVVELVARVLTAQVPPIG